MCVKQHTIMVPHTQSHWLPTIGQRSKEFCIKSSNITFRHYWEVVRMHRCIVLHSKLFNVHATLQTALATQPPETRHRDLTHTLMFFV